MLISNFNTQNSEHLDNYHVTRLTVPLVNNFSIEMKKDNINRSVRQHIKPRKSLKNIQNTQSTDESPDRTEINYLPHNQFFNKTTLNYSAVD